MEHIYKDNAHWLVLDEVKTEANTGVQTYQTGLTVRATITDGDGVAVPNIVWPRTLAYVATTDGRYAGELTAEEAGEFVEGRRYTATVEVLTGSTVLATYVEPVTALLRHV